MPATTGRGRPERRHPALDGLEVVPGEPPPDHELEHRLARGDERAHGVVAALQPQVARVEPVGRDGDVGLGGEALLLGERARCAAFWPASSGSKVKTTSPRPEVSALSTSPSTRRITLMWSTPKLVPQVATAVVTPARWQAITSV